MLGLVGIYLQGLGGLAVAQDLSLPGQYAAGTSTVTVTRSNGSTFSALLYYPSTTGGANAPIASGGSPFSAISFGHGFLQDPARYFGTMTHLATHGHIVIASTSETGILPNHTNFSNDMRQTLTYLTNRNNNGADPFFGRVDTNNYGMFGHSMGGGAGLLAAAADNRIKAYAGLAAAITNPSPQPLMPQLRIPVAMLTGDEDGIVNYNTNTVPLYNAAVAPKLFPLIDGGYHVGFQDTPYPIFPDSGSLPAAQQLAITRSYLTSYFGLYLKNDQSKWRGIWGPEALTRPGVLTLRNAGVTLQADAENKVGNLGSSVSYNINLTNTGPVSNSFSLFSEDHQWTSALGSLQTPNLLPGQSYQFSLSVNVPTGIAVGLTDSLLLSARSDRDGGTRGYVWLNTVSAVPEPSSGLLVCLSIGVGMTIRRRRALKDSNGHSIVA
jgi:predicted dienelactone hydrolase